MPDTYGYGVDEARAKATVAAIFDGPVNFLDTARLYGFGRSEERIGAAIRERGGLPKGFVISTKLDRDPKTTVSTPPRPGDRWSKVWPRSASTRLISCICTIRNTHLSF